MIFRFRKVLASLLIYPLLLGLAAKVSGAQAYVIADASTGYILDQLEPAKKRQIGSLTKIATAMVTLDWAEAAAGDLNQMAVVPEAALATGNNDIGFQPGDTASLRDLLYAALVQSDNVAAYTIASHVGAALQATAPPSTSARATPVTFFVQQMNVLARRVGMQRTQFLNPVGLDENEKPTPFSTAADLARLTRYAMNKAAFRFYVSQKDRKIAYERGPQHLAYKLVNTNELLGTNGVDGVKTGRTRKAGDCLILSANRASEVVKEGDQTNVIPRRLIVVLLGCAEGARFNEGAQLLARGWQLYDQWAAGGRLAEPKRLLN